MNRWSVEAWPSHLPPVELTCHKCGQAISCVPVRVEGGYEHRFCPEPHLIYDKDGKEWGYWYP